MDLFKIGTTSINMVNLAELDPPVHSPNVTYKPFQIIENLGNLHTKGMGTPSVVWEWGFLSNEQRDMLRASYCPGSSADVFISTKTTENNDAYEDFSAIVIWPLEELSESGYKINFSLTFINLVSI